jgi:hypothetical protein
VNESMSSTPFSLHFELFLPCYVTSPKGFDSPSLVHVDGLACIPLLSFPRLS